MKQTLASASNGNLRDEHLGLACGQNGNLALIEGMDRYALPPETLGHCAAVPNAHDGRLCPPTAQFADRRPLHPARNRCAAIAGRPTRPFSYRPAGQLSSIGHNRAVAEIFGLRVSVFLARLRSRGSTAATMPRGAVRKP